MDQFYILIFQFSAPINIQMIFSEGCFILNKCEGASQVPGPVNAVA